MSERDYFSLRYTVPGFALILVVIGLNYKPMHLILARQGITDILGLAISILTLFASSAIGFLISQIWFTWFHRKRLFARILEKDKVEDYMAKAFHWKLNAKKGKERDVIMSTLIGYFLNTEIKSEKIFGFFQRKIDLYHTMSCAWVSLLSGLVIGLSFRGMAVWSWSGYGGFDLKLDYALFFFTVAITATFVVLLYKLSKTIFIEYHPMLKLILNNLAAANGKSFSANFKEVFPEYIGE